MRTQEWKNVQFMLFQHDKNDENKIFIIPFVFCQYDQPTNYGWVFFHCEMKFIMATVFIWAQATKNIFFWNDVMCQ